MRQKGRRKKINLVYIIQYFLGDNIIDFVYNFISKTAADEDFLVKIEIFSAEPGIRENYIFSYSWAEQSFVFLLHSSIIIVSIIDIYRIHSYLNINLNFPSNCVV